MIKTYFPFFVLASISLFGTQSNGFSSKTEPSKMHKMQQNHPDSLPRDQRVLMHKLSPKYQNIYISILTEDERDEVVEMYRKGENPYRMIDLILKNEKKDQQRTYSGKSLRAKSNSRSQTGYMAYEQDPSDDADDYVYEKKDSPVCVEKKKPYKKGHRSYKKLSIEKKKGQVDGSGVCFSGNKKRGQVNPSFTSKCKAYYKEKCVRKKAKNSKKHSYKRGATSKRYSTKKCKCSS
jgi:hypothetical protein